MAGVYVPGEMPEGLSDFERKRLENMKRNHERMKQLNLDFTNGGGSLLKQFRQAKAPRPVRKPNLLPLKAVRRSGRVRGSTATHAEGLAFSDDEVEYEEGDDGDLVEGYENEQDFADRRMPVVRNVDWTGPREYSLPRAVDQHGNDLGRNKSCHICTQCVASWRGNFTMPLACTTCSKIFCNRCLFHIRNAGTIEEVDSFIGEAQGQWSCFVCTGSCACQDPKLQRLPKIDRHKMRGWVGVTGGFTAASARPRLSKRRRLDYQTTRGAATAGAKPETSATVSDHERGVAGGDPAGGEAECSSPAPGPTVPADNERGRDEEEKESQPVPPTPGGGAREEGGDPPVTPPVLPAPPTVPPAPRRRARPADTPVPGPHTPEEEAPARGARAAAARAKLSQPQTDPKPTGAAAAAGAEPPVGQDAVGRRVECFWEGEGEWYPGVVKTFKAHLVQAAPAGGAKKKKSPLRKLPYRVVYDDGDFEDIDLPDESVRFI